MRPVLQALVLADHVYTDRITGKKIIAGTFQRIGFSRRPPIRKVETPDGSKETQLLGGTHSGSPYLYMSLTDLCKGTELLLQFVNLSKNVAILGMKIKVECEERLRTVEVVIPLPVLPINEPGIYALEVLCGGEILGSHRVVAEEVEIQ